MEVLKDEGVYRHLSFTKNGSRDYQFDLHTWPGYLCVSGDMGTYVFSRISDMFNFFIMGDNDFNSKHVINPGYWAEKLQAVNSSGTLEAGCKKFSMETFKQNVKQEYDNFCEAYLDEDDESVSEAYPEDTQTYQQMLEELWECIEAEVLSCDENGVRAYDAAMDFRWQSDCGKLKFDMEDFWEYDNTEYTFHYIWILYAIVHGIKEYNKSKEE